MTTDAGLLILGDSHAVALKAGCEKIGQAAELLSFSGNFWHSGHVVMHRRRGLWARGAALQGRIVQCAERLGAATLPRADMPLIATFGFHLGRILPMFNFGGHRARPAEFEADADAHYVSSGLVRAYADHFRRPHVAMMKRLASLAPTVAIAPPLVYDSGNFPEFLEEICRMIAAEGVTVVNPCAELFGPGAALPQDYVTADGVHGTADYGALVIALLQDRGLIPAA